MKDRTAMATAFIQSMLSSEAFVAAASNTAAQTGRTACQEMASAAVDQADALIEALGLS